VMQFSPSLFKQQRAVVHKCDLFLTHVHHLYCTAVPKYDLCDVTITAHPVLHRNTV
jgi:glyoxylate utilization-related uncharacterized protein